MTLESDSSHYTGTVLEITDNGDLIVQLDDGGRRRFESATTTRIAKKKRRSRPPRGGHATPRRQRRQDSEVTEPILPAEAAPKPHRSIEQPTHHPVLPGPSSRKQPFCKPTPGGIQKNQINVQQAMHGDILICTALFAAGSALGLSAVCGEVRYHIIAPATGFVSVTATICVGVLLGFWIPRRVIRRHIKQVHQHRSRWFWHRIEDRWRTTGIRRFANWRIDYPPGVDLGRIVRRSRGG